MGIFNDNEKIRFLEKENKEAWKRIVQLESKYAEMQKKLTASASESAQTAAYHSKKAAEYRNRSEERLAQAGELLKNIEDKLGVSADLLKSQDDLLETAKSLKQEQETLHTTHKEQTDQLIEKASMLHEFLKEYPDLDEKIEEVVGFIEDIESNLSKSQASLSSLNSKRKEIEGFHQELFGYKDHDDDGEEIYIEGQKAHLENLYADLANQVSQMESHVSTVGKTYREKFEAFEKGYRNKYEEIVNEIAGLLPNALTAGLSAAYSKKGEAETASSVVLQKRFKTGINMLIAVSVIPFIVSIVLLIRGELLDEVMLKIPRLVLAIIPMYIPVLWYTYSANKKLNLSKRLIEEYAHKEVLSKTYEGLSKQIAGLKDEQQTAELKFRLLSSFLQVASENPGKLISNYETSDHPIMEALEQSYKFQVAVDRLGNIPGVGHIAAMIETRSKKRLAEKEALIDKALANSEGQLDIDPEDVDIS